MPQFHETGYGRKFFDVQLPALIKAINKSAEASQAQADALTEQNTLMATFNGINKDMVNKMSDSMGILDEIQRQVEVYSLSSQCKEILTPEEVEQVATDIFNSHARSEQMNARIQEGVDSVVERR